jgi:hypothetical protein
LPYEHFAKSSGVENQIGKATFTQSWNPRLAWIFKATLMSNWNFQ